MLKWFVCLYLPHSHKGKRSLLQRLLPFWQAASLCVCERSLLQRLLLFWQAAPL